MNLDQKAEPKKSLIKPKETVRLRQLKWLTLGRCGPPLINKWLLGNVYVFFFFLIIFIYLFIIIIIIYGVDQAHMCKE